MSAITAKASRKMKKYAVLTREPRCFLGSFDFSWEQRKLSEMCGTFEYGLNAAAKEFDGKNKYIRITDIDDASREFLLSDLSSPDICLDGMSKYLLSSGDIVFARTGASVGKTYIYRENDGIVYFAGFLIRAKVNQDNDAEFVFQSTLSPSYEKYIRVTSQRSGQPGVNAQEYGEYDLFAPSKEEQQRIGQFLRGIDNLITLHQRKFEKLTNVKKSMLEKMFPQNGSSYPEIRFKGFTDPWEQRKLGEMGQTYTGLSGKTKDDFGHGQARFVTYMNVFSNPISNPEMTEPIEIDPKQNEVEVGDVFFTTSSETPEEVGMSSILLEKRGKTYLNSFCFGFRPSEKIDSYYLAYMLRSESTRAKIILLAQGISRYNISKNKVMEIAVSLPSLDEQKMIGQYFSQLDNLITLHQRECISFTGRADRLILTANKKRTTSSWEQRKLGDIGKARSGVGFPDADQGGVTGVPFFKVSDMNLDGNENEMIVANNYVTAEQIADHRWSPITELPAIFFAKVGAAVMLNRKRLCRFPFLLDNNTMAYSLSPTKWDADFAKALFGTVDLTSLVQVGALPSYNARDVESMGIYLPSLFEQEQIGAFFKLLDNLITLHQRKPFLMKWRTSDANRNQTNRLVL